MAKNKQTDHPKPQCMYCANNQEFDLPDALIEACVNNKLVIFAGAGISTESKLVYPTNLYEDVAIVLGHSPKDGPSFSKLMSEFVSEKGRRELLHLIKKRLDYVDSFNDLRNLATRFHKELSTIPFINEIVTTNWDTLFEEESGAIPIVTAADYAFWDMPGRKVFKIHGSISNIGTIIATHEDYMKCYKSLSNGVIGASLKHMLATKTVVFVGYSFRDEDFQKIYSFLQKELGDAMPKSYIITRSNKPSGIADNSVIIHTDGSYFMHKLKESLVQKEMMLDDARFPIIDNLLFKAALAHQEVIELDAFSKYPELIYTSSYQEGLIHALERIHMRHGTGEYSDEHHISHLIHSYDRLLKGAVRAQKYFDASYIDGYLTGLFTLVLDNIDEAPVFYLYGYKQDINTLDELSKLLGDGHTTKTATKKAVQIMHEHVGSLQPVHTPFLSGIEPI
jgi:NAD-dependent SIR2 family protein deacetylase